jgi:prophage DNA circulation protein
MKKNLAYHYKTKHIDVQYDFMRDMVENNKVLEEKVAMLENKVDSLTNFVSSLKFYWCKEVLVTTLLYSV